MITPRVGCCGECRLQRRLVAMAETRPFGDRRPVCARCRDELVGIEARWFAEVDRGVRQRTDLARLDYRGMLEALRPAAAVTAVTA